MEDWINTVATFFSSGSIKPSSLILELHFHNPFWHGRDWSRNLDKEKIVWNLCDRVVTHVVPWGGFLKDFFVHNYGTDEEYRQKDERYPAEAILKRKVMGEKYDSLARGKGDTFLQVPLTYLTTDSRVLQESCHQLRFIICKPSHPTGLIDPRAPRQTNRGLILCPMQDIMVALTPGSEAAP
ncbi:hypothetical protein BDW74DRAFT_65130 [Aspergillus multicolor]|uniref:uncharacterized protein n=1 Tax=Aspergillus multicolor TaxID=41759 RepID=UPI003CCD3CFA